MNNGNIWTQDPKAKVLGQNNIQLLLVEVEKGRASPPMHKKKIEIFLQFPPSNNILQKLLAD